DEAQGALAHLAQCWHANDPDLAKDVDQLRTRYNRQPEARTAPAPTAPQAASSAPSSHAPEQAPMPDVVVNSSSDKAWKQTLMIVADLLCERYPESPIGYSLRR
ncbi:type VI secretion system protein TssA, partial [Xenorhabdus bovienii]